MNNQDHHSQEAEPKIPLAGEGSEKVGVFRLVGSTVLLFILSLIVIGAFFNYDFENHSTARFVIFEIVFIGLTVKCFYWMRDSYRKR